MTFDDKIKTAFLYAFTGRAEMPKPEPSKTEVLRQQSVPTLRWRHYELTAEQARYWAVELLTAADAAEKAWSHEEQARESKEER
jgi:hypothetical protein